MLNVRRRIHIDDYVEVAPGEFAQAPPKTPFKRVIFAPVDFTISFNVDEEEPIGGLWDEIDKARTKAAQELSEEIKRRIFKPGGHTTATSTPGREEFVIPPHLHRRRYESDAAAKARAILFADLFNHIKFTK